MSSLTGKPLLLSSFYLAEFYYFFAELSWVKNTGKVYPLETQQDIIDFHLDAFFNF